MRPIAPLLALALFTGGCVHNLGEERLGRSRAGYTVDDCIVPRPAGLRSWGAPVSVEYPDRSLWIWDSVTLEDGTPLRNAFALVDSAEEACDGTLDLVADATGNPVSIVSLTAEEESENATRTDGRQIQVRATGGFAHNGRGYLYYEKILAGPGFFDAAVLGIGLCIIDQPDRACTRVQPGIHPGEPTLLWDRTQRLWNRGALVAEDGHAYLFGCLHAAAFEDLCTVARVDPAFPTDPSAYRFYNVFDGWIEDPWNATVVFETAGLVTPGHNAYLGKYVAVTPNIWDSTIEVRFSDHPWGEFGNPVLLFDAVEPEGWFIGGGAAHSGLTSDDGRVIAISYFTDAPSANGLHLVRFRFDWAD